MSFSRSERRALCALLGEKGPQAPTLCEGWSTRDLAAHLVLREHRPDAAAGILGGPLAAYTARVQRKIAQQHDYARLIAIIEQGPPRLSLFGIPGVDERANAVEFFVHHEDVRRGSPGWEPRPLDPGVQDLLWRRLAIARLILRKAPCGVTLQREGAAGSQPIIAKRGAPAVTVTGTPGELTMWVAGRKAAAQVQMEGDEDCVARLSQARWGL
ncbi:MAG: TIGR03085 family metal-binding protein [Micromonosporaceae bacterium]